MEHARGYICKMCASAVPAGHKFCGGCGASVPDHTHALGVTFYGASQEPGRVRLVVIRGVDGAETGESFLLVGTEHVMGRSATHLPFANDLWQSPQHASFEYRDGRLHVRDMGSLNGVFVRIREAVQLTYGSMFVCGSHVFRLDEVPPNGPEAAADRTYVYASPRAASTFFVTQVLATGVDGTRVGARDNIVTIGRSDCDFVVTDDGFVSPKHARLEATPRGAKLHDEGSLNGVFVRITKERALLHGDYVLVGQHLFRAEVTG